MVSAKTAAFIETEEKYLPNNYHPIPVVLDHAENVSVWDVDGKEYFDFLGAYSAVNQGHCHPRIREAAEKQMRTLTLCSRAFHSKDLGAFAKKVCELTGFDKFLPTNSGAEAVDSAIKVARRWAYQVKKVPADQAVVIAAKENFHGRTIGVVSFSTDPEAREDFGPFLPGIESIPFNDVAVLEDTLKKYADRVAAFICEPIQGEGGIIIPDDGYLTKVSELCKKYNALWICDEVQSGMGRTGKLFAHNYENVKPDLVTVGKALSGGFYPISAVLGRADVLGTLTPGSHGSTFGGNSLACAIGTASLDVIIDENLGERALARGKQLYDGLRELQSKSNGYITAVRGRGLMIAMDVDAAKARGRTAWQLCNVFAVNGILAKPTHDKTIRFAPPLTISEEQVSRGLEIIAKSLDQVFTLEELPKLGA